MVRGGGAGREWRLRGLRGEIIMMSDCVNNGVLID